MINVSGERFNTAPRYFMIKFLIILMIFNMGCSFIRSSNVTITFYSKGTSSEIKFQSQQDKEQVQNLIGELISDTDDILRLLVSDERINNLKQTESGIEIKYSKHKIITSKLLGDFRINRLYIPFSGEFTSEKTEGVATIFLADTVYLSGPLRISDGMKIVKQLQELIEANTN